MKPLLLIGLLILPSFTWAQNLYTPHSRILYGRHLMSQFQYERAMDEFQAIPSNTLSKDTAIALWYDCLMSLGRTKPAGALLDSTYGPLSSKKKFHHAYFYQKQPTLFSTITSASQPDSLTLLFYHSLYSLLGHREWEKHLEIEFNTLPEPWNKALYRWHQDRSRFEPKNQVLAGILSIIPGGGQLYVGNKADALMAFSTIGIFAFQTYRGYHQRGWKNGYTITFGALTAGFYLGNIYGGQAAAKRYNELELGTFDSRLRSISARFSTTN